MTHIHTHTELTHTQHAHDMHTRHTEKKKIHEDRVSRERHTDRHLGLHIVTNGHIVRTQSL